MYIEPNTTLILLNNCPLTNTYEHTIYFETPTAQENYFRGLQKQRLERLSYQRHANSVIRVQLSADDIFDCNYLMFKNTSYENKWFYAFILDIEYVSNQTCNIYYELDVMQTWFFDYELKECFVEREHTVSDEIFEHRISENISVATDKQSFVQNMYYTATKIMVVSTYEEDPLGAKVVTHGQFYGNYYSQAKYTLFDDPEECYQFVNDVVRVGGSEAILNIMQVPAAGGIGEPNNDTKYMKISDIFDTYTPRNNKLYNYPFVTCSVSTLSGNSYNYKPELLNYVNGESEFTISKLSVPYPNILVYPSKYMNIDNPKDYGVFLESYPPSTWGTSLYSDWMARNQTQTAVGTFLSIIPLLFTLATPTPVDDPVGALVATTTFSKKGKAMETFEFIRDMTMPQTAYKYNLGDLIGTSTRFLSTTASNIAKICDVSNLAPNMNNNTSSSTYMLSSNNFGYRFSWNTCNDTLLKSYDDYFDKYGYTVNTLKQPTLKNRPHWTYVKTTGCDIIAHCPVQHAEAIKNIFNSGITFWVNGNEVGNYSLDNRPQ